MSIHKTYAVFGLGRYGLAVAKGLSKSGAEVLAVDIDENIVNSAIEYIPFCKCADVTSPDVIKRLGIGDIDVVIIAMAQSLEASVMATMLCKEAGVKTVIVKCSNEMHQKILSKVGADQVVVPEIESGARLARNLLSSGFVDLIELSNEAAMVELNVQDDWAGKSLLQLDLRKKYGVNVVAIREGDSVQVSIDPQKLLTRDMQLIVIANTAKLSKLR